MPNTTPDPTLVATKLALRITTDAFDSEITRLINSAKMDLGIAGVEVPTTLDAIVTTACITYVKMHFGQSYDRGETLQKGYDLKQSYDEQKAQLATCTGYTDWLVNNEQV